MVVGEQESRRYEEPGTVVGRGGGPGQYLDPADRLGRLETALKEIDADDVAAAHQALERVGIVAIDQVHSRRDS